MRTNVLADRMNPIQVQRTYPSLRQVEHNSRAMKGARTELPGGRGGDGYEEAGASVIGLMAGVGLGLPSVNRRDPPAIWLGRLDSNQD